MKENLLMMKSGTFMQLFDWSNYYKEKQNLKMIHLLCRLFNIDTKVARRIVSWEIWYGYIWTLISSVYGSILPAIANKENYPSKGMTQNIRIGSGSSG